MIRTKIEWRRALLKARSAIPADVQRRDSAAIADRIGSLSCLASVRSVLAYRPIGAEADSSVVCALPGLRGLPSYRPAVIGDGPPRWVEWFAAASEDGETPLISAAQLAYPVMVIVPGVGFDPTGVRLGRGAGFYDRALADLRKQGQVDAVGMAFECQIVAELPVDPWDERVDYIVTERRVMSCRGDAAAVGVGR